MHSKSEFLRSQPAADEIAGIAGIIESLGLIPAAQQGCPNAVVLSGGAAGPVAAVLGQSPSFEEDRRSIETLKAADPDLPIIFISTGATNRRERAIRRLCIHYFLAHPAQTEELRLVLDVLARVGRGTRSIENEMGRHPLDAVNNDRQRTETGDRG